MDDSQLISACKKQDRDAQRVIYEKYGPTMMGICMRYAHNRETAEDLLHDGFIRVFTHIGSFTGKGSFEGWLKRIFVNLAIENYRREKKEFNVVTDSEVLESDIAQEADNEYYIGDITQSELMNLIRELSPGYRTIFNLYVLEEMSHKEISKMLGISEAASRSQFSRAKALLKKKINAILQNSKY